MVNKKDLRGGAEKMREVARLLTLWADDLESSVAKKGRKAADAMPAEPAVPAEPVEEEKADAPEAAAVSEPAAAQAEAVPAEPLTFVKVQGLLAGKSAAGFKTQVLALIRSYGAEKLSEVDPAHYTELVAAVNRLDGDGYA